MGIKMVCRTRDLEYVKRYVNEGRDIEVKDPKWKRTPLSWASERGCTDIVRFLLDCGANVNTQDKYGQTPLMYASNNGFLEIAQILVNHGAHINAQNESGWTAVTYAVVCGHENIVRFLVEQGVDLNMRDLVYGRNLIMWASVYGFENIIRLFMDVSSLANGSVCIEARDKNDWTALMSASANGKESAVRVLVERGANVNVQDDYEQTPVSLAFDEGHFDIASFLISAKIQSVEFPYSGAPISFFFPQRNNMDPKDYIGLVTKFIPSYLDRAVKDPVFGIDMQRDIEEILRTKTTGNERDLTRQESELLTRLLKALRAIDYTDRQRSKIPVFKDTDESNEGMSSAYDMEL